MSARRVLAGSVAALLLPASLLLTTEVGSASDSATPVASTSLKTKATNKKAGQKVTVEVLPQIVQQGRGAASADKAKAGVTATIKPVKVGRKVVLEQSVDGSKWKKVGTAKQEKSGRAYFSALVSKGGLPLQYRVTAQKFKGLKAVRSSSADTAQWLTPTFTDEFSGSTLSPVWSMRGQDYDASSKRKCSKGSPKAVKVGGGAVRLSVIKDKSRKGGCLAKSRKQKKKIAYRLNGHIGTDNAFSFKYGVMAARVKMQKMQGQHASFWSQPTDQNGPHSAGNEIDVIEYFGDKHPQGGLTSFIHWYKGKRLIKTGSWIKDSKSFLKNKKDGWSKNYHVFSVQWTPKVLVFRIDGKETWRTSAKVSHEQQYLILSLLASDYEALDMPDKKLPQHMYVDWVRVWETPQA